MNHYISGRVTQEMIGKEMARRAAVIQSGYAFFVLQLRSFAHQRVSGVDTLIPKPGNMPGEFTFDVVSKHLEFSGDYTRGGLVTAYVLDTENNRKFLASHLDEGYWEIIEVISGRKGKVLVLNDVLDELNKLKEEQIKITLEGNQRRQAELQAIKEAAINIAKPKMLPPDKKLSELDLATLSDDELQEELRRRAANSVVDIKGSIPTKKKTPKSSNKFLKRKPPQKKAPIVVSSKKDDVVVDGAKNVVVSDGSVDSNGEINSDLLSPIGMVQP